MAGGVASQCALHYTCVHGGLDVAMDEDSPVVVSPDLTGEHYIATLNRLHAELKPKTYLEIGVFTGWSLALARCASIGVDPVFKIDAQFLADIVDKPSLHLFSLGSDDFFGKHDPSHVLQAKVDFAFLDGMHRCEFLLRDFMNTERHCEPNSVVALHDCLPVDTGIVDRDPNAPRPVSLAHRENWWAGDVWRTSLLLRRVRPDLKMTVLDCSPTGLVLITNLDPGNQVLSRGYAGFVETMRSWELADIGVQNLFAEMAVQPASALESGVGWIRRV